MKFIFSSQKDLESYPKAWKIFKKYFKKCPTPNIPKELKICLFYSSLRPKFHNFANVSMAELLLNIPLDNALDMFERIAENESARPLDREMPRKTARVYNVDISTLLITQMEALIKRLDSLTLNMNMVQ